MTIQRMDNVLIVVDDLEAAKAFFAELGMELEGETTVEGRWVDRVVGLNDVRADMAMMRTPDGHSRLELTKFHTPPAVRAKGFVYDYLRWQVAQLDVPAHRQRVLLQFSGTFR